MCFGSVCRSRGTGGGRRDHNLRFAFFAFAVKKMGAPTWIWATDSVNARVAVPSAVPAVRGL